MPCASHQADTPSPVAKPKALPPDSTTAWHSLTLPLAPSAADSRVPGAPPRMATAPREPVGGRTTVHPVLPSEAVHVPTLVPATPRAISSSEARGERRRGCGR